MTDSRDPLATAGATDRPILRAGVVALGAWLSLGLVASGIAYANIAREGRDITLWRTIAVTMPIWVFWALATPLVILFVRRWPFRGRWAPWLAWHVVLATLLHVGASVVSAESVVFYFPGTADRPISFGDMFNSYVIGRWPFHVLIYAAIAAVWLTFESWRRLRERELHASQLEAQLAHAQLAALRMQLNPHFLFNTLQAISVLTVESPRTAQRMLTLLGDLLRAVLDGGEQHEVPLRAELQFVRRYLEIEQMRFGERLQVTIDADAGALDRLVPTFVLQPLVENAIRHAVAPRAAAGRLTIAARLSGPNLVLTVSDDGPGLSGPVEDGVGLATTRARLAKLYGDGHAFRLSTREAGGAEAVIELRPRPNGA